MSDRDKRLFHWSWQGDESVLPPFHLYPAVEFVFKVMQWGAFAAALKVAAGRFHNSNLSAIAGVLFGLLIAIVGEKVARFAFGHVRVHKGDREVVGLFGILGLTILSMIIAGYFAHLLYHFIGDLVVAYEATTK